MIENEETKSICSNCGEETDELKDHNDGQFCTNCEGDFFYCEESETWYKSEDHESFPVHDKNGNEITVCGDVCNLHYFFCEKCNEYHHDSRHNSIYTRGTGRNITEVWCDGCVEYHNVTTCSSCDLQVTEDYSHYSNYYGEYYCDSCSPSYCEHCDDLTNGECNCGNEEGREKLNGYNFKPTPKFLGNAHLLSPFMGFELEVENKKNRVTIDEAIEEIEEIDTEERLYFKEDGSLTDGFEIVSHPSTLDEHKKEYNNLTNILKSLSSNGFKSHDTSTCGLHVHIDKTNMTDSHKTRLGVFFALFEKNLSTLARRKACHYAQFKKPEDIKDKTLFDGDRYQALNWNNAKTVEIRIFKGTLKKDTFFASLELCHALYCFTLKKECFDSSYTLDLIWSKFILYLKQNRKVYSYLIPYLESKDLLTFNKKEIENKFSIKTIGV